MMKRIFNRCLLLVLALTLLCLSAAFAETSETNWRKIEGQWFYVGEDGTLYEHDPSGLTLPPADEAATPSTPAPTQPVERKVIQESADAAEPEATEEPKETAELTEEPERTVEPEVEDRSEPLSVTIYASHANGAPRIGDTISLLSNVTGAEDGAPLHYQWQYRAPGGGWMDVADANESTYNCVLDEVNAQYTWRLIVTR